MKKIVNKLIKHGYSVIAYERTTPPLGATHHIVKLLNEDMMNNRIATVSFYCDLSKEFKFKAPKKIKNIKGWTFNDKERDYIENKNITVRFSFGICPLDNIFFN